MQPIRFVHAANLRLDTPLTGLTGPVPDAVNSSLAEAPATVLIRLTALCDRERPDFLLLTGHTLNPVAPLLGSRLRLLEAFAALARLDVPVLVLPTESPDAATQWARLRDVDELPANVRLLKADTPEVSKISDATGSACPDRVLRNERVARLYAAALQAGHSLAPWSGNAQGLGFHELGPHGCVLVEAMPGQSDSIASSQSTHFSFTHRLEPLSPVEWRTVTIQLERFQNENTLEAPMRRPPQHGVDSDEKHALFQNNALQRSVFQQQNALEAESDVTETQKSAIQRLASHLSRRLGTESVGLTAGCELVVLRLILEGETPPEPRLHPQILEHLRGVSPLLWPAELQTRTLPPTATSDDMDIRRDLAGELVRLSRNLEANLAVANATAIANNSITALITDALAPLYAQPPARLDLPSPTAESLRELVRSATALCLDQLDAASGRTAREKL